MTPIQAACLPIVLAGSDVIGQAKTGSGKTAVFGLGLLQTLDPARFSVQALVLCPTRELAEQVGKEVRRLARGVPNVKLLTLCGGKPIGPQKVSLRHGAHIVVGTPGRVLDHLRRGSLRLDDLRTLVLDEADRMLDMGFEDDMQAIVEQIPARRQTLLFSATFPEQIQAISKAFQTNASRISVETTHSEGTIEQLFFSVTRTERNDVLRGLFEHYQPDSAVVFCPTKKQCSEVADWLREHSIDARALHGDLDQRRRDRVLARFANGSISVLVATDVAARGLDIEALPAVFNYELPHDPEVYVHRIGRTGRAGAIGLAISLFTEAELKRVRQIEAYTEQPCLIDVPQSLDRVLDYELRGRMATLELDAGKKSKLRPGDLLGALTGEGGLQGDQIGKIDISDNFSLVAVERSVLRKALDFLANGKVKGRKVRARKAN